ncbi:MAG: NAD(P)-binding domain-containing protein [Anaerobutyricum soehngenii]
MRTGIIGAGKVGCSLGKYFRLNNLKVTGYYDVNENLAKEAATFTETTFIEDLETIVKISDTLFLTVPDDLITTVWNQMKDMSLEGKFICHCSGALSAGDHFPELISVVLSDILSIRSLQSAINTILTKSYHMRIL